MAISGDSIPAAAAMIPAAMASHPQWQVWPGTSTWG
jgi:hypothetical protein